MNNLPKCDSKTIIKYLCALSSISLAELVRRRNELHPNDKTTPQNLSNKLSRDSLRLAEFIELANCAGYNVIFEETNTEKQTQNFEIENTADSTFKRNDFNMLYDYLWRDIMMAEYNAKRGKSKQVRAAAQERIDTLRHVVQLMAIIEHEKLTYSNGKIYRDGTEVR